MALSPSGSRFAAFAALCAVSLAAMASRADETLTFLTLFGKVTAPLKGGVFELREKRGSFKITVEEGGAEILVHKVKALKDTTGGAAHILGKRQGETSGANGERLPAQIVQVQSIVLGEKFTPPEVPKDLAERRIEWLAGALKVGPGVVELSGTNVQAGADRKVVVVEPAKKDAIAKGKLAWVVALPKAKGSKDAVASSVSIVSPETPAAELKLILGLP